MVTLAAVDANGIDWTQDLIGNANGLGKADEDRIEWDGENYIAKQDTVDWWQEYISDMETTEREMKDLAEETGLPLSEIRERVSAEQDGDYNDHRAQAIHVMRKIREECEE